MGGIVGIDVGGTFTDLFYSEDGVTAHTVLKVPSTPDDPSRGAIQGLEKLLQHSGVAPQQIGRVVHATTLFTNALIERKGAPTGLITTAGFGDVLERLRNEGVDINRSQLRWAINSGKIEKPPMDGSLSFVFGQQDVERQLAYFHGRKQRRRPQPQVA